VRRRLTRISPLQLGIVLALLYGLLCLVFFTPIFVLMSVLIPQTPNQPHPASVFFPAAGTLFAVIMPVIYAAFGFVFGIIGAAIYNLVARMTGGIEFTVEDAPASS
jgi:hypothetical protein